MPGGRRRAVTATATIARPARRPDRRPADATVVGGSITDDASRRAKPSPLLALRSSAVIRFWKRARENSWTTVQLDFVSHKANNWLGRHASKNRTMRMMKASRFFTAAKNRDEQGPALTKISIRTFAASALKLGIIWSGEWSVVFFSGFALAR